MSYLKRTIEPLLTQYLCSFRVVGITGPRQSGKTTLLQHALPDYRYVSMDDLQYSSFFYEDPVGFMETYNDQVIFDEVHYTPELFRYIKLAVDKEPDNYGKFVLTSSSQFSYLKSITESLAGRIGLLSLLPLELNELPTPYTANTIIRGNYPELVLHPIINKNHWYSSYVETYIHKDVQQLSNIGQLHDFRRFMQLLAANTSQILDMKFFANQIGVTSPTIKHWISVLEASYVIFLLPSYHDNFGKRIVKRPKLYFYDTGLVSYLTGIQTEVHYSQGPMAGALFENYVVAELLKYQKHHQTHHSLYYLRTSNQEEIDVIIDRTQYRELVEIKKTSTFKPAHVNTIQKFLSGNDRGTLIYNGTSLPYKNNISICNIVEYFAIG